MGEVNVAMDSTAAIISAICAALAVGISFYSVYKTKQRLEVRQYIHKNIEYKDLTSSYKHWYNKRFLKRTPEQDNGEGYYRVIVDLILINKSAVNITILNYVLNDKLILNSDFICNRAVYDISYKDTMSDNKLVKNDGIKESNSRSNTVKSVSLTNGLFPLVNLNPYEVKVGQIVFCTDKENLIRKGTNKLAIDLGNKTVVIDIQIGVIEDITSF